MKNFLFECTDEGSYNEGEEFLVGADNLKEARKIAKDNFVKVRFICELTDEEAEASGLDEY